MKAWSPILEGEVAARAGAAIDAVAESLTALWDRPVGPVLASGDSGIALLYEYLDRARPGAGYGEIAGERLERAIETVGSALQIPFLYGGFTGVSWVVEQLQGEPEEETGEEEEDDPNADIDAALFDYLDRSPWPYDYDLISGLVGYGVYALERLPRPSAAGCLERVVERLAELAAPRPGGLVWHTPREMMVEANRLAFPQGADNLGVAHGNPGVIALLARVCASGVAAERARSLLAGAVPWLLEQKLPANETSVFPYSVGQGTRPRPARTAWCYGDPGIAMALLLAGRAAGEPEWEREALELARTIARRPPESCGVNDAGLCHGAAGLGHLLNRFYQATGDPELLAVARAWFGRALESWEPGRGVGGFLAFAPPEDDPTAPEWQDDPGFLTGSAGVALALLAAITGVDPAWDRVLLLSPLP